MDEIKDIERIASILAKKRMGDISDQERLELDNWANKSAEYRNIIQEWETDGVLCDDYKTFSAINVARPMADMKRMINHRPQSQKRHTTNWLVAAASIAAIILLFFGVRTLIHDSRHDNRIAHIQDGQPTLLLDDGREIVLEGIKAKATNGTITIENEKGESHDINLGVRADLRTTYNTILIPQGHVYELMLDDGTRVWLNADSRLKYPIKFKSDRREVELTGEAYFAVSKDATRPFTVITAGMRTEVLGTEFNIRAYGSEPEAYTTLIKGCVKVTSDDLELTLNPGEQAILSSNELTSKAVNVDHIANWRNGMFVLENKPLEQIMSDLSRWYNFDVSYENASLKSIVFNGIVPQYDDFDRVLTILRKTGEVDFVVKNRSVYVTPKK